MVDPANDADQNWNRRQMRFSWIFGRRQSSRCLRENYPTAIDALVPVEILDLVLLLGVSHEDSDYSSDETTTVAATVSSQAKLDWSI